MLGGYQARGLPRPPPLRRLAGLGSAARLGELQRRAGGCSCRAGFQGLVLGGFLVYPGGIILSWQTSNLGEWLSLRDISF